MDAFARMIQAESDWATEDVLQQPGWSWAGKDLASSLKHTNPLTTIISGAKEFIKSKTGQEASAPLRKNPELVRLALSRMLTSMHLFREELKLQSSHETGESIAAINLDLASMISQLGRWMDWPAWDWKQGRYYSLESGRHSGFEDGKWWYLT
jgi:hypothetical protein